MGALSKRESSRESVFAKAAPRGAPAEAAGPLHAIQRLQRTMGNQALQRLLRQAAKGDGDGPPRAFAPAASRTMLVVNRPGDAYERDAERAAEQVMRMPGRPVAQPHARKSPASGPAQGAARLRMQAVGSGASAESAAPPIVHEVLRSPGRPLDAATRAFMEPRFGADFGGVRVHTDGKAESSAAAINAVAYTVGRDIVFSSGRYQPGSHAGAALLAHELAHVVQQSGAAANGAAALQRTVELRPPGRGEASAFERRDELVARLNTQSAAIQYHLDGRMLRYEVKDEAKLRRFDRQMMAFIDAAANVPMRLLTHEGRMLVRGVFVPVIGDQFASGYVDLDDLLTTDDLAFQSILVHFLTERLSTPRYEHLIGMPVLQTAAVFNPAHATGHDAQAEHFRDVFSDPSIRFTYQEIKPDGTAHIVFRSHDRGYYVFLILHRIRNETIRSEVMVRQGGRWISVADFLAQRAAAPAGP